MNRYLKDLLTTMFERIDKVGLKLDKLDKQIREKIGIFDDENEVTDPDVVELVKQKKLLLSEIKFLFETTKELAENVCDRMPKGVRCDAFVNKYKDTQKALDYINSVLDKTVLLDGTRDLFTGLGYTSYMGSYTPMNLYYVAYKMPLLFGVDVEIDFEQSSEDYKDFLYSYIYEGLKKDVQAILNAVKGGSMCSFDYLANLSKQYSYLKDNFKDSQDIHDMLMEIQELNYKLFGSSPLIVYGRDLNDE